MQSGGGNPMNAAQLARLQQQLAQYGGRGQQQQMMNPNAMGGMGNPQQQQLQQAFMQQQQLQQNQTQQGGMQQMRRNSQLGMSNSALAMMQQQQQQAAAGNSQMANAQMSSYFNQLNQNSAGGAMDASSASSAQLAALAGMNMQGGSGNAMNQSSAANMLLGNRGGTQQPSQQQQQQPPAQQQAQGNMGSNSQMQGGGMGQTTDANLLQQQIAQLQRQLQQQQQTQQPQTQGMPAIPGNSGMGRRDSNSSFPMQQQQQQQLFQQMQQMGSNGMMSGQDSQQAMSMPQQQSKLGNEQFSSMAAMMQGQNPTQQMQNMQQNLRTSASGGSAQGSMAAQQRGSLNEQDLLMQQQQLLRSSGMSQTMQNDAQKAQEMFMMNQQGGGSPADLMGGQRRTSLQPMDGMGTSISSNQNQTNKGNQGFNNLGFDMDGSMSSQRSASRQMQNKGNSPLDVSSSQPLGDKQDDPQGANQKSFLDGSFAGGWQSNADLPDRRRIIFSILEVIRQMRPDTNKISQKLPHMAKSLEEHLYRSAQTKEEYLDPSTLKKRLQLIAHGLEIHRSTSSGSVHSAASQNKNQSSSSGNVPSEAQQLQQFLVMQQGNNMNQSPNAMSNNSMSGMGGAGNQNSGNQNSGNQNMQMDLLQGLGGSMSGGMDMSQSSSASAMMKNDSSNYQDRIAAQKKKVIRQQQQRLLLLRHASKCKEGPACKTKFCGQMMTLWKHMKKCRDKNCKTSHCLSSRCVLNHYRICKSQGRTSTCEVCGPVMEQIKRQDQGEGMDSSDPLAAKPDPDLPNQAVPQLQQQVSTFGQVGGGQQQNNVQAMQQQAMQQLYQQQQQAIQQNQQGPKHGMQNQQNTQEQNNLQALGGGSMSGGDVQNPQGSNGSQDPQQLQQLQSAQQKLYQQQQVLKQLQKQQAQLLEQQKQLQEQQAQLKDPGTQQGQQLQQQHALLQQLQRRCQQQQALIQQELVLQMKALRQGGQGTPGGQDGQQMGNNSQSSQHSQPSQLSQNQMQRQNSVGSQNQSQGMQNQNQGMQGQQLQAQMQALSQSHLQAVNDNNTTTTNNTAVQQMQMQNQMQNQMQMQQSQLQNQMQNQMQGQPGNQDQLLQLQQVLNAQQQGGGMQNQQQPQQQSQGSSHVPQPQEQQSQDQPAQSSTPASPGNSALTNIPQPMSQPLSEGSEKGSNSKRRTSVNKPRTLPSGGRGKGARGRGGKGKRLRDIADDLGSAANRAGGSINKSSADAAALSVLSKKRTADDITGDNGGNPGEPSSKISKTEGNGPLPDSQTSDKNDKQGGNGNNADGDKSEKKDGEGNQNSSLTSSMPKGDVEQHLLLLHKGLHLTSRTITHKCLPIVQQLIDDPFGWVFRDAVDPVVFGLPDYFEVVKNPMHLLLVKKKLENAVYTDMASFERDVKLVFENAILYNGDEAEVGQLAQSMMGVFEREYKKVCEVINNDLQPLAANACSLCGIVHRQFEPPVLYCVGVACGMQRIKRKAIYHTYGSQQNCWCEKCYGRLRENEVIMLDDGTEARKSRLIRSKHDLLPEETWIQCQDCNCRVHQVCALYNDRMRKPNSNFWCPKCVLKNRPPELEPSRVALRARDLQRCKMSDSMEEGLEKTLAAAYDEKAKELGVGIDDVDKAKGLSVRVLSHIEKKHIVRDEMYQRYSKAGCPSDFPVHTKCVGLFQSIDSVDVLLFAMYVYEYGQECPAQNRRRVYISYLDSVQFFEPRVFRTVAYQSVIVEYLRFVKKRGFHTAHIWSCPPTPGDEYVFYCHPPHQKIPQEDKLRSWYYEALNKAKAEGVVVETTNFHDEYFVSGGTNAPPGSAIYPTSLPYFEGDYIPGEIENILSGLTKEERRQEPVFSPSAPRRTGSKLGTRSNPGQLVNQSQDKIMLRLGKAIYNMKENLMVVRLRSKRFVAAVERGDEVSGWPDDDDDSPQTKGKDSSSIFSGNKDGGSFSEEEETFELNAMKSSIARHFADVSRSGKKIGTTVDDDPQFESEMFENRQLFLNYCQSNHCQFDDLRRAKHSTMMVLFQLLNPAAPKSLQQCGVCNRDIAWGNRFRCNICPNFDLCEECYRPVVAGAWTGRGARYTHDTSHSFSRISVQDSIETKKGQEEREKSLKAYLEVLAHAANCGGPPACKLNNCEKMKKLFVHVKTCDLTHQKGCKVCARLLSLIIVHARSCTIRGRCSLPFCDRIRERNERLRRQQQFMDDRRRQAQNAHYGAVGQ